MTEPERERWRAIAGYDGRYEVSDLGRMRSTRGRLGARILSGSFKGSPYKRVTLTRDGRKRPTLVHVLVLETFVGPRPAGMEGCHNDGDLTNNSLVNLRWDTPSGNNRDKARHGTQYAQYGESCNLSKLSEDQVREIRARYAAGGISQKALARDYGVFRQTISVIVRRKTWNHIPPEPEQLEAMRLEAAREEARIRSEEQARAWTGTERAA